jgi:hypothetical protein
MAGLRQQLADTLATADAVVVSGETGSGKTTQVSRALRLQYVALYIGSTIMLLDSVLLDPCGWNLLQVGAGGGLDLPPL